MPKSKRPTVAGSDWLGWQKVDKALNAFETAARNAIDVLAGLNLAEPAIEWLKDNAIPFADDIQEILDDNEQDLSPTTMLELLEEEGEYLSELLDLFDGLEASIEVRITNKATAEITEDIVTFVSAKLKPVRDAASHLYDVLIQAA